MFDWRRFVAGDGIDRNVVKAVGLAATLCPVKRDLPHDVFSSRLRCSGCLDPLQSVTVADLANVGASDFFEIDGAAGDHRLILITVIPEYVQLLFGDGWVIGVGDRPGRPNAAALRVLLGDVQPAV